MTDILFEVLEFINDKEDLYNFSLVCRSFRFVIQKSSFKKKKEMGFFELSPRIKRITNSSVISRIVSCHGYECIHQKSSKFQFEIREPIVDLENTKLCTHDAFLSSRGIQLHLRALEIENDNINQIKYVAFVTAWNDSLLPFPYKGRLRNMMKKFKKYRLIAVEFSTIENSTLITSKDSENYQRIKYIYEKLKNKKFSGFMFKFISFPQVVKIQNTFHCLSYYNPKISGRYCESSMIIEDILFITYKH